MALTRRRSNGSAVGRPPIWLGVVALLALVGATVCVLVYVLARDHHPWVREWIPSCGASLAVAGLGIVVLNILIDMKVQEIEGKRLAPHQAAVAMLLHQLSQWLQSAHCVALGQPATQIWPDPLSLETLRDVKRWIRRLDHLYSPLVPLESWQVVNDIWLQVDRQLEGIDVTAWANQEAIDRDLAALQKGFLALAPLQNKR